MGLSSNSVIHFTNTLPRLKGILNSGFTIKYCRETYYSKTQCRDLLVPIVSFCDTPFTELNNHIKSYGSYGIGLSKEWAIRNGLNPVLYLDKDSTLSENILKHLYEKIKGTATSIRQLTETDKQAFDVLRYIKNYQGDLIRSGKKTIENYRFSDEREWRYALHSSSKNLLLGTIKKGSTPEQVKEAKNRVNKAIGTEKLRFKPTDISYIIIKNENQRDEVIRTIELANGEEGHNSVKRLTSRIISVEQLLTDF